MRTVLIVTFFSFLQLAQPSKASATSSLQFECRGSNGSTAHLSLSPESAALDTTSATGSVVNLSFESGDSQKDLSARFYSCTNCGAMISLAVEAQMPLGDSGHILVSGRTNRNGGYSQDNYICNIANAGKI